MGSQLIVAGFHRSGTSLSAQILHRAGLFLGDEMLSRHQSNPRGHFEDCEIVRLHNKILADNGLTWQVDEPPLPTVGDSHLQSMRELVEKREAAHETWGFKDPRVCLFMEAWKDLLPDSKVLLVYRNFAESVYSLHKRHAYAISRGVKRRESHDRFWEVRDFALKMWLVHNKALLDFARAHPEDVLTVSFDMLRKGFPLVRVINQLWDFELKETETREVFDPEITIENSVKCPVADKKLAEEVLDVWEALERLGGRTEEIAGTSTKADGRSMEEAFYGPVDTYDLLMEREFLRLKTQFLDTQIEERLAEERNSRKRLQRQLMKVRRRAFSPQRKRELERAEADLQAIVRRTSQSRLAPIFRLNERFRELEQRYLK